MDLTDKSQLINYLKRHGLWAKKSMGQNFLVDRSALEKIVEAAELSPEDTVLEIGPGLGVLTEELVKRAGRVTAVEKDEKLASLLHGFIAPLLKNNETVKQCNNFEVLTGDALDFEPESCHMEAGSYKLVANIPYYITSKILEKYLSAENKPSLIVVLVQKEVAERICAKDGGLSVLAVSVRYYGEPEMVGVIKRDSFFPAPNVDSAILKIRVNDHRSHPQIGTDKAMEEEFFKIVRIGFQARRKTLFNNLKSGTHLSSGQVEEILDKMGIAKNARAQELSIDDWKQLTELTSQKSQPKT